MSVSLEKKSPLVRKLERMYGELHRPNLIDSSNGGKNAIANQWIGKFNEKLEEPTLSLDKDYGWPIVRTLPWFHENLTVSKASERLEKLLKARDKTECPDDAIGMVCDDHADFLETLDRYDEIKLAYTYNEDNNWDRDFQFIICKDLDANRWMFVVSLHTGVDARWGFTEYYAFEIGQFEDSVVEFLYPRIDFDLGDSSGDWSNSWESSSELERAGGVWDKETQSWSFEGKPVECYISGC